MASKSDPYRLMKYVARGAGEGIAAGWVTLLILKYLHIGRIGDLLTNTADGPLMFILALVMFGITFGMVGIAWRVMVLLPKEDD